MNEIERLALRFLAIGHVTDSEAQYQKLAMKSQVFAVFTLNKKLLSKKKKGKILKKIFIGKCSLINSSFYSYSLFYCLRTFPMLRIDIKIRLIQAVDTYTYTLL